MKSPLLLDLIHQLNSLPAPIWKTVAKKLERGAEVNVSRIERYTKKGDIVVVPGKVLGSGTITKPVTVGAWAVTAAAREKVKSAGGKCVGIETLAKKNPKGSGLKILE